MSVRNGEDVLVAQLSALAPQLDGEPDPAFRAATRARLVAMAAVRTPAPPPVSPIRRLFTEGMPASARWRTRLTAGLAGAALTVTALAALVAVAEDARPGDALYGLKRGTEQAQLALAGDARGETLLELADTRLDEVRWLVTEGATALPAAGGAGSGSGSTVLAAGIDPELVSETLRTMDAQTAEGVAWLTERAVTTASPRPLQVLSLWAAAQSEELDSLRDDVPAAAEDAVADSLVLLADVTTRVTGVESSLACPDGPAVTTSDELGPVPGLCQAGAPPASPPEDIGAGSPPGPGSSGTPGRIPDAVAPPTGVSVPPVGGQVPGTPGRVGPPSLPPEVVPTVPVPTTALPPLPSTSLPLPTLPGTPALPTPGTTSLNTLGVCVPPLVTDGC